MTDFRQYGFQEERIQEVELSKINKTIIQEEEKLAGLEFTDSQRELMVAGLNDHLKKY